MVLFYVAGKLSLDTPDDDCQVALHVIRALQASLRKQGYTVDECVSERDPELQHRYLSDKSAFINRQVFSGGNVDDLFANGTVPDVEWNEKQKCYVFTAKGNPEKMYTIAAGATAYVTTGEYANRIRVATQLTAMIEGSGAVFRPSDPVLDEFGAILRCAAAWTLEKNRCNEEIVVVTLGRTSGFCAVFNSLVHIAQHLTSFQSSKAVTAVFKSDTESVDGRLGSQLSIELSQLLANVFS